MPNMPKHAPAVLKTSRRGFLGSLGGVAVSGVSRALFPSWMPRLAFRQNGAPGDVLVAVFLRGGMDALNAVIPYGEGGAYYDQRPTIAIPAPDGSDQTALDLNGFFGLHPALRPLKDVYDAGSLAVIHAVGSPDPTRSHFDAMEYMERGTPGMKVSQGGWLNRHLQTAVWENDSPFRAVGMGAMLPTSLHGAVSALALQSITDFHLGGRWDQAEAARRTLTSLYRTDAPPDLLAQTARDTFSMIDFLATLNAADYTPANGAAYAEDQFGMCF
ncbi:MAG: hypothetical protein HS103_04665 [Anaerolineales bacterium]|nr:hypothetical protein [Anaerolineales bacterium]